MTKSNEPVGNFPGVTVGSTGKIFETEKFISIIYDLPGTYGLSDTNPAEIITKNWLIENNPDVIVNIVDSSNLQRNLVLTLQLLEFNIPTVIILNKMDVADNNGIIINLDLLKSQLNVPLFLLSATKKKSLTLLKEWLINEISILNNPLYVPNYSPELVQSVLDLKKYVPESNETSFWQLTQLVQNNISITTNSSLVNKNSNIHKELEEKINFFQANHSNYKTILIEERQKLSRKIIKKSITRNPLKRTTTQLLDQVLADKYLGIPIFLLIIWIMFQFTFELSRPFTEYLNITINWAQQFSSSLFTGIPNGTVFYSFLIDGILSGVGTVLSFLPIIFFLFIIIAILEDSGYFARGSFIVDKLFVHFGLEGRSFVPMILGFGCNIPGILSTRNITGKRERYLTISIIPFMSCSARLPVYILLASIFFLASTSEMILFLYLTGVGVGLILLLLFKMVLRKKKSFTTPLILEMPPYMIPSFQSVLTKSFNQIKSFLKKITSTILIGTIIVWLLSHITINPLALSSNTSLSQNSLLYIIGSLLEPIFSPLGFNWKLIIALIFGVLAKELIISTLAVLYISSDSLLAHSLSIDPSITPVIALAYMVFILLYTPCLPTISMIKSETNKKFTVFVIFYTFTLAYILSFIVLTIGNIVI